MQMQKQLNKSEHNSRRQYQRPTETRATKDTTARETRREKDAVYARELFEQFAIHFKDTKFPFGITQNGHKIGVKNMTFRQAIDFMYAYPQYGVICS